jgi:Co/Zn/Cd efflux system component
MARRGIADAAGGFLDVLEHRLHIGTPLSQIGVSYEARDNAAIRLAYIHDIGDVWVSLAPVSAGLLLTLTGYSFLWRRLSLFGSLEPRPAR